jgi:hypothetical protein
MTKYMNDSSPGDAKEEIKHLHHSGICQSGSTTNVQLPNLKRLNVGDHIDITTEIVIVGSSKPEAWDYNDYIIRKMTH